MINQYHILEKLGFEKSHLHNGSFSVFSPIQGEEIARLNLHTATDTQEAIIKAEIAFQHWRLMPAPKRGELMRLFGEVLRENKDSLGHLVTIECGKVLEEGKGEVQEMIDICDFAVGLSRQLYGLTIASERPGHRMMETWHPLGVVAIISAFNFPVAVWAWNFTLAIVCGNAVIWKPSEKTPLCALACQHLFQEALRRFGHAPEGLSQVLIGDRNQVGETLITSPKISLVSATGSCRMGHEIAPKIAQHFGRSLLELGGNNAMIVCPSADLEMTVRAVLFSAVGTAGHSQFKNIMYRKGAQDKKRAKVFSKIIRELTVAARDGGDDANANPKLRAAIINARTANMPKDTMERAIKRGMGGEDGINYEEIRYEGYGPGGVAIIVDALTDNRNRSAADIRAAFSKFGGNLGETNSVSFMFDRVGLIQYPPEAGSADALFEVAVEAGADDVESTKNGHSITTSVDNFGAVRDSLYQKYGDPSSASLVWQPKSNISVTDEKTAQTLMKLIEVLEDNDDVQVVSANFDIPEDILETLEE